jgi:hypothetical protein
MARRSKGRRAGAAESTAVPPSRGKEREVGGRGSADRWGHGVSGSRKKKRKSGQVGRCGREKMGRQADWAERKVRFLFFCFFFSNTNKTKL